MHPRLPKHIHPKEEPQTSHPWLSLARRTLLCPRHAGPGAAPLPGRHSGAFPPAPLPEKGKKQPKFFQAVVMKPQLGDRHFPGPEQPLRPGQQRRGAARTRIMGGGLRFLGHGCAPDPIPVRFGPSPDPGEGAGGMWRVFMAPGLFTAELGSGSGFPPPPRQPRTEAALDGIKTFLAFPGKGFPKTRCWRVNFNSQPCRMGQPCPPRAPRPPLGARRGHWGPRSCSPLLPDPVGSGYGVEIPNGARGSELVLLGGW